MYNVHYCYHRFPVGSLVVTCLLRKSGIFGILSFFGLPEFAQLLNRDTDVFLIPVNFTRGASKLGLARRAIRGNYLFPQLPIIVVIPVGVYIIFYIYQIRRQLISSTHGTGIGHGLNHSPLTIDIRLNLHSFLSSTQNIHSFSIQYGV